MPIPVSRTSNCRVEHSPSSATAGPRTVRETCPRAVNLIALLSRFSRIWRTRTPSVRIVGPGAQLGLHAVTFFHFREQFFVGQRERRGAIGHTLFQLVAVLLQ